MKLNKWLVNAATAQAYKDGRADAESEHDKMCETCIHKVSASDIAQIRADAIEGCKQILLDAMARDGKTKCHNYMVAINEMEQLKEQNEDGRTKYNPG